MKYPGRDVGHSNIMQHGGNPEVPNLFLIQMERLCDPEGRTVPRDLGGSAGTRAFGQAVAERVAANAGVGAGAAR